MAARYIVCGGDNLAYRLVRELVDLDGTDVTVVCPPPSADGPPVADIPGVTVVTAVRLDRDLFQRVRLDEADAVAIVAQNDGGNIDAALLAREVAPHVRMVLRLFDETLAESMRELLADCAVLSSTAVAAPAFVAAAAGGDQPTALRIGGRLVYAAERRLTRDADIVSVLSTDGDRVLGEDAGRPDDLVLTTALRDESRPTAPVHGDRVRRRARHRGWAAVASLVGRRLRVAAAVLAALLAAATLALMAIRRIGPGSALYLATLTAIDGSEPTPGASAPEKAWQLVLAVLSVALIPAVTAAVVEAVVSARLALASGGLAVPVRDHYIVVGLGDVGTRVLTALDDAGEAVVGVDTDPNARGAAVARQRRVPVTTGDGRLEATLRAAEAPHARGLLALTDDDVTNLEIALVGRRLGASPRTVLRIFDAGFADRAQRAFGFTVSRSVSSLAAPSFAAAMLGREVIATIAVHRRVLLVVEIGVGAGSALEGASIAQLGRDGATRVVAIRTGRGAQVLWQPPPGRLLVRTDHLVAVTTRAGLGALLTRTRPGDTPPPLPVVDLARPDLGR